MRLKAVASIDWLWFQCQETPGGVPIPQDVDKVLVLLNHVNDPVGLVVQFPDRLVVKLRNYSANSRELF